MNTLPITDNQLTNWLSQPIKNLYLNYLELQLGGISYQLFENKLIILIDGSVTQSEHLLSQNNRPQLARQVRTTIDKAIQPKIKKLIEERLGVNVVDFFSNTTIDTGRTGVIALFEFQPHNSASANSS